MDEKETKSLTIGDILDQLVKPPITQSPPAQPSPATLSSPRPQQPAAGPSGPTPEIKLPQLGKSQEPASPSQNNPSKPVELRLSIRTMAADLERLKRGQTISAAVIQKTPPLPPAPPRPPLPVAPKPAPRPLVVPPTPTPPPLRTPQSSPQAQLPPMSQLPPKPPISGPPPVPSIRPGLPPVRPSALPPISTPPAPGDIKHYHAERVVGEELPLPPFLGAPIPKKVKKSTNEKIEYGLIARIVGSGMTTGISITLILAATAYGLLYFFYLKPNQTPIVTSTPTPSTVATPEINELKAIFGSVAVIDFTLPQNKSEALPSLKTFVDNQNLLKKEFKRLNLTIPSGQEQTPTFTDLMSYLSLSYPPELKDELNTNDIVLIYGQEELLSGQSDTIPKKIVFIAEIKDLTQITDIMTKWEQTMPNDLKDIFDIDPAKAATQTFLTNEHRGVTIRYKNFPLADKTIDYAILSSLTNHHYLIISNSRESMYSPTEKILGL